jgi:KEOPS complex subunit Cgi121
VLKYIEEFGKYCGIVGFRNVEINNCEGFLETVHMRKPANVEIQYFDASIVATWQHLYFAVVNALTAFRNGRNISRSLAMETMLYASGRRQIQKAIELIGIKPTSANMAILMIEGEPRAVQSSLAEISHWLSGQRDDMVLGLSDEKMGRVKRAFDISETELETIMGKGGLKKAIVDLVIERMALLATAY